MVWMKANPRIEITGKVVFVIALLTTLMFPTGGSADNWCADATRRWNEIAETEKAYFQARECKNVELKFHELELLTSEMVKRCSGISSFIQANADLQSKRNEIVAECKRKQSSPLGHN
jgi:hypothetical protein